jgi:hypothetical protein
MLKLIDRSKLAESPASDEVGGIMVQAGRTDPERPLATAFVWGRELRTAPSLPFGRWKAVRVQPAA